MIEDVNAKPPKLTVFNHQRAQKVAARWIHKIAKLALPDAIKATRNNEAPLLSLGEIEVSIVSDEEIGRVHAGFLGDPEPTDVITFHHGEILVSADTAARRGPEHGNDIDRELALYVVHGLLHLAGWDDEDPAEQQAMHALQEKILNAATNAD